LALSALRIATLVFLCVSLASCARDVAPLSQEVYVWQRVWSAANGEALQQSRTLFSGLRVLAAQVHPREGMVRARVDLEALRGDARPVVAVLRIDGEWTDVNVADVIALAATVIREWSAAGIALRGIEIDYDCASSKLAAYTNLLRELRATLPAHLPLSITVLPTWIGSDSLRELLSTTDQVVLQVHAVDAVSRGLFDASRAETWIDAFAKISPVPYSVSLPTYGAALIEQGAGKTLVEHETSLSHSGNRVEISADPRLLARFANALAASPRRGLVGLVWFRLPTANDRRAWSLRTLASVVRNAPLESRFDVQLLPAGAAYDVEVRNAGNLDGAMPSVVVINSAGCEQGDALADYTLEKNGAAWRFSRTIERRLVAGTERVIGWLRCTHIDQASFHVEYE
jgi:hypothetical protein